MTDKLLIILFAFLLLEEPLGLDVVIVPGLSTKNAVLYVLLVVIILRASVSSTEFKVSFVSLHSVFILLIAYTGISWAISAVGYEEIDYPVTSSFISLKNSLVDRYLFMFVYLYALKSREQVLYVARALLWIVLISSFVTLIDLLNIPDLEFIEDRDDGRVQGLIDQPNQYGGFLAFWIPACIGMYLTSRGSKRIIIGVGILISIGLLVLTGSRGAMAATVAGSLVAVVILRRYLPARIMMRGTVAALLVTVAISVVVGLQFTEVVEERFERTTAGDAMTVTSGRSEIWSEALSKMNENKPSLLHGNGWMSWRLLVERSSHNTYLRIIFELGAIGLILYVTLLYVTINLILSGLQYAQGAGRTYLIAVIFSFCAVAISTAFSELFRPWMLIWAYAGLMLRLALIEHFDAKEKQPTTGERR